MKVSVELRHALAQSLGVQASGHMITILTAVPDPDAPPAAPPTTAVSTSVDTAPATVVPTEVPTEAPTAVSAAVDTIPAAPPAPAPVLVSPPHQPDLTPGSPATVAGQDTEPEEPDPAHADHTP